MKTRSVVVALLLLSATQGLAQTSYPDQPVRILVGFTPGTAPDVSARILADKFTEAWGKPVIVENITGASGNIACDRVAKSPPDGYTLTMCGNGNLVMGPSLYEKLPFDPLKDFTPITQIFVAANILAVHPDVPAKNLPELVALARAQPDKLIYGHTGIGTSQHMAAELFKYMAKVTFSRSRIAARRRCCPICSPAASACRSATSSTSCRWSARASCAPSR